MRIGIIGDVHGRPVELLNMLLRLEKHGVDRIVSLGDLVDRGPTAESSVQCVRLAQGWSFTARSGERRNLDVVVGNHEENHIYSHFQRVLPFRDFVPKSRHQDITDALTAADYAWLDSIPHWLTIDEGEHKLCFTHGGVLNNMTTPGWYGKQMGSLLCRIGYLAPDGKILSPWERSERFWADEYDGKLGHVFFGHTSFKAIRRFRHATGVDCSKYGSLAALVWSTEGENPVEMYEKHAEDRSSTSAKVERPSSSRSQRRMFDWDGESHDWRSRSYGS